MAYKILVTNGTKTETILETKGINPFNDERHGAWSPDPTDIRKEAQSIKLVPSMFAGVRARMAAMSDLPFTIYSVRGDKELDNSDHYQNVIGILPNPYRFLALSEGSLVCAGALYWYKGKGIKTGKVKELTYWKPSSVTLDPETAKKGDINFRREGQTMLFPADDVLYAWGLDPDVELGPPTVYPFASAVTSAQADGSIKRWVADYMQRGAIKAMMLMVDGMPPPAEVERMETWFNRFMAGAKSLTWKVFNSAGVKPTIIGDGLEALRDLSITQDLRYDVHTALGTRHLLEDENFATSEIRDRQFYTNTIVPSSRIIQTALNDQLLHPMGYHLEFEPGRLESFQVDEASQVAAFGQLLDVFMKGLPFETAFILAAEKLDYQFTDEQMNLIRAGLAEKEQPAPVEVQPVEAQPEPMPLEVVKALAELDKLEKKIEFCKRTNKPIKFTAIDMPSEIVIAVVSGDMSIEQARANITNTPAPKDDDAIKALAAAIEKAVGVG